MVALELPTFSLTATRLSWSLSEQDPMLDSFLQGALRKLASFGAVLCSPKFGFVRVPGVGLAMIPIESSNRRRGEPRRAPRSASI